MSGSVADCKLMISIFDLGSSINSTSWRLWISMFCTLDAQENHYLQKCTKYLCLQVFPDLNLEPDRLLNPFFYHSRLSIGIDCTSISKFQFSTTCSRYHQSDNKSRIGEKWVLKSVSFQVEIRTDLLHIFKKHEFIGSLALIQCIYIYLLSFFENYTDPMSG